jgi:hypothetical protein
MISSRAGKRFIDETEIMALETEKSRTQVRGQQSAWKDGRKPNPIFPTFWVENAFGGMKCREKVGKK